MGENQTSSQTQTCKLVEWIQLTNFYHKHKANPTYCKKHKTVFAMLHYPVNCSYESATETLKWNRGSFSLVLALAG